jgi:hypothetical protein
VKGDLNLMKKVKRALVICGAIQLIYIPLTLYMIIIRDIWLGSGIVALINALICVTIFANVFSDNLEKESPEIYEKLSYEEEYRAFGYADTSKPILFAFSASNLDDSADVKKIKKYLRLYYLLLLSIFLFLAFAMILNMALYYV